ncbi:MAG: polysaccharide biosynthesis protein [Clostridium sp.]|uniref:putative polysaccharide biosynthesis protein n=1 Tax=Clostridium sp. TaxID=1506 RepID=UPI00305D4D6A
MGDRTELTQNSVAKGFMVMTIAMMSVKVLSVLYTPLLRYILGTEGYGIYYSSYTIFTYIYTIANAGIPVAIAKLVSELEAQGNYKDSIKTFKASRFMLIIVGLILSVFMFVFATPLSSLFNSVESTLSMKWLAPGIFLTSLMCAYKGYFQGTGNMTPTAVALVGEQTLNIIFSLICAYLLVGLGNPFGAAGGTIGTVVGALGASLYFIWIYSRNRQGIIHKKNDPGVTRLSNSSIVKSILKYAIPITVGSALQSSGTLVDLKTVKARLLYTGLSQSNVELQWGYLSLYNTLISIPMAMIGALAISLLPAISRVNALSDKKSLRFNIKSAYRVTFMIAIPCAIGLGVLSMPIVKILGYDIEVSPLLIWGSWVLILYAISLVQTSILQGMGKVTLVTVYSVIGIIAKIFVNYILVAINNIGILGAIFGNAVCYLIMVILFQYKINKSLGMKIKLMPVGFKPMISGVFMGIITVISYRGITVILGFILSGYILNFIATLITIAIAAFSYSLILVSIGGVNKSDLRALPNRLVKFIPVKIYNKLR